MKIRIFISAATTAIVIMVLTVIVIQKERILVHGDRIYLKLAPVDPRSLIQGDYMDLRYALGEDLSVIREKYNIKDRSGITIIKLDKNSIAVSIRMYEKSDRLKQDEKQLKYKLVKDAVVFGANSFFFQEGKDKVFEKAKYGELVLDDDGSSVLVGLRDEQLNELKAK